MWLEDLSYKNSVQLENMTSDTRLHDANHTIEMQKIEIESIKTKMQEKLAESR